MYLSLCQSPRQSLQKYLSISGQVVTPLIQSFSWPSEFWKELNKINLFKKHLLSTYIYIFLIHFITIKFVMSEQSPAQMPTAPCLKDTPIVSNRDSDSKTTTDAPFGVEVELPAPVKQSLKCFTDMIFKHAIENDVATVYAKLIKLGMDDFKTYATRVYPLSESERNRPFGKWVFSGPMKLQQAFVNVSLMTFLRPYALFLLRLAYGEIPSIKAEIDGLCVQDAPDFVLYSACFSLLGAQCLGNGGKIAAHLFAQMQQLSLSMMMFAMVQNKWPEFWPHVRAKF